MISDLVRARRGNQWHQPLDEFAAFHEDVGGAVAPARLEAQRESSIRAFLESLTCEWWARDVAAEPLEASPVMGGNGDSGVKAHAAMLGYAIGGFWVGSRFTHLVWLDAIAEASPWLAAIRARRDALPQRGGGKQSEQWLLACQRVFVVCMAGLDHALDSPRRAGQHPANLVGIGR